MGEFLVYLCSLYSLGFVYMFCLISFELEYQPFSITIENSTKLYWLKWRDNAITIQYTVTRTSRWTSKVVLPNMRKRTTRQRTFQTWNSQKQFDSNQGEQLRKRISNSFEKKYSSMHWLSLWSYSFCYPFFGLKILITVLFKGRSIAYFSFHEYLLNKKRKKKKLPWQSIKWKQNNSH